MNLNSTHMDTAARSIGTLGSPYLMVALVTFYLYFVLKAGPQFMSKRKPYNLKAVMMAYNQFQVLINIYLLYLVYKILDIRTFSMVCNPISTALNEYNPEKQLNNWVYYTLLCKLMDLFDTVFFVLRKKQSQLTFLHLFHHTSVPVSVWVTLLLAKEEMGVVLCTINNIVHVIMYSYYFLSGLGPSVQKYLGWKKYLTLIQIIQFIYLFYHANFIRIVHSCKYHIYSEIIWNTNVLTFLLLFINYYRQSYNKDKTKAS